MRNSSLSGGQPATCKCFVINSIHSRAPCMHHQDHFICIAYIACMTLIYHPNFIFFLYELASLEERKMHGFSFLFFFLFLFFWVEQLQYCYQSSDFAKDYARIYSLRLKINKSRIKCNIILYNKSEQIYIQIVNVCHVMYSRDCNQIRQCNARN